MSKQLTVFPYTITAAGGTLSVASPSSFDAFNVVAHSGAVTLTGNMEFANSGTAATDTLVTIYFGGGVTIGVYTLSFFGVALTAPQALTPMKIEAFWNGSAWIVNFYQSTNADVVNINGNLIINGTVNNDALAGNIALTNLATAGGNDGNILQSNGTNIIQNAISGDATITDTGVLTIGNGKITPLKLSFVPMNYFVAKLSITSAQILALNGTPLTIVAAPGSGYFIDVISATTEVIYDSAAYATYTTLILTNGGTIGLLQDTAALLTTVSKTTKFQPVTAATAGQTQIIANTALMVTVPTGNPITGNSPITINVIYAIVPV